MNSTDMNGKRFKEYKPAKVHKYGAISRILEQIEPGQKILDVGCSEGHLAQLLPANQVWGVDINPNAVQKAREYCVQAEVRDLNRLDEHPLLFMEKFEFIVFADVLEHLVDPQRSLEYFKVMLEENGRVIVSLPNVALWRVRMNLLFGRFDYGEYGVLDNTHLHLYTFKSARRMTESAGYKIRGICGAANLLGVVVEHLPFLERLLSTQIIIVAERTDCERS